MAMISTAEAKEYLKIGHSEQDTVLGLVIAGLEDWVQRELRMERECRTRWQKEMKTIDQQLKEWTA